MRFFKKRQGLDKVKFWLIILMVLFSAAIGLRIGVNWPERIAVPDTVTDTIYSAGMQLFQYFQTVFTLNKTVGWTVLIISLSISCVIVVLCLKFSPNKRHTPRAAWEPTLENVRILLYLLTAALCGLSGWYDNSIATILSAMLGILTVAAVWELIKVLQDVYVKRNSEDYVYFEQHKKSVLIKTTLIGMALVGLPTLVPDFWGFTLPSIRMEDLLGYYTALLSLTFISISVMSVLSDRTVVIYWENIAEGKLIKPVFGSFAAYTYYSVGAAVGAGICVALNNTTAFIIFCTINIATMILLTYTMVDVYYDRESKKISRQTELQEDTEDYLWVIDKEQTFGEDWISHFPFEGEEKDYTIWEVKGKQIGYQRYTEKMMLLCQHLSQAYDEHDLMYLQEVHTLYQKNLSCFDTPDGKRVVQKLFSNCTADSWPLLLQSLRAHLNAMTENRTREEDPFPQPIPDTDKSTVPTASWDQDEQLWRTLIDSQHLRQWLQSAGNDALDMRELLAFLYLVARRLVLLYNDMVTHCRVAPKEADHKDYDYLKVSLCGQELLFETEAGAKPKPEQMEAVFNALFCFVVAEGTFAARLLRLLYVMLENLSKEGAETVTCHLKAFSLLNQFTPFMSMLDFSTEETALWAQHFPGKASSKE